MRWLFLRMILSELQEILDRLVVECKQALSEEEVPVSCCLLLSDGTKIFTHNRVEKDNHPFHHAEFLALEEGMKQAASRYLKGATLIVSLEPCLLCMGAILKAGIDTLYYVVSDEKLGALSHYHTFVDDRLKVIEIEDNRFQDILKDFFTNIRK